jgi:hypothetical protein
MSTLSSSINVVERWLSARIADVSFDEHGVAAISCPNNNEYV